MTNEDESRDFREKRHTGDMGHTDMGHTDMGHTDMGHTDMGHTDMGHTDMGHTDMGRSSRASGAGGGRVFAGGPSRETGVVVRATVESYGPVGETELQVNVKWPAGCNSAPVVEPVKRTTRPPGGRANVA